MAQQLTTALTVTAGLILLFHLGGLIEPLSTPNSVLLNSVLDPESLQKAEFWITMLTSIQLVGIGGAVTLGILTKNVELAAMVSVATFVGGLLFDIVYVYNVVASANQVLALVLFGPPMLLFGIIMVDWWRRND